MKQAQNIFMALNLKGVQMLDWSAYMYIYTHIYICNLVGSSCRKLSLMLCANICKGRLRILGDCKQHISTIIHLLQEQSTVRRPKRGGWFWKCSLSILVVQLMWMWWTTGIKKLITRMQEGGRSPAYSEERLFNCKFLQKQCGFLPWHITLDTWRVTVMP